MQRLLFLLAMTLCAGPLLFSQTAGNTRYVAVQTVTMKSSTGFFAKNVRNLSLGDTVTLVRENGKWSEVRAGNLSGWIASSSLSARRVIASNSSVTIGEVALAGKGFSPDTEMEYKKDGLNYSMVDSMEQMVVPADDLLLFINEGRLSKGE